MRQPPFPLMVFAAGFGTRMRPLTDDRPKPLVHVAGRPLLDHALDLAGPRPCVVNAHYRAEMIVAHLADRPNVTVRVEQPRILDTGGGVRAARPALGDGPVLTLNSDAVWRNGPKGDSPLDLLEAAFDPAHMDALLLLIPTERALGHAGKGDFHMDATGRLTRGPGLVYTGAQAIAPALIDALPDGPVSLNAGWDWAAARNRLFGLPYPGLWCDVGTPQSIALAETMLATPGGARP